MSIMLIITFIQAYLIGSISTAILVGRIAKGDDIRAHGSGNAGATNALRTYGKKAALIVTLGDCFKASAAILTGIFISKVIGAEDSRLFLFSASLGAILGHNFPLYFKFRGGKGILVSAVGMFFADWRIGLIVTAAVIVIIAISRYVSLGSVMGAVLFAVLVILLHFGEAAFILYAVLVAALAVFKHRTNIKRLLNGTENKIGS